MKSYLICSICACFVIPSSQQPGDKRYRNDYEYNSKTDAFYKFHTNFVNAMRAEVICKAEGGQLMVPNTPLDIEQVHGMFKRYPDLQYVWVGNDGESHESTEEDPIIDLTPQGNEMAGLYIQKNDILSRTGEIGSYPLGVTLPFVCKVEARNIYYDSACQVYGKDYELITNISSCYKLPKMAYTWNQAYEQCEAEGAHLVVINSEAENQIVWNIIKMKPSVPGAKYGWYYFLGYRADKPKSGASRVFRTIFNQTLEEAGFVHWGYTEPNNIRGKEYCVSMWINDGTLNDINCMDELGFICEKNIVPHNS